jgi:tripartite-type tricarboxylate transporter receptor subunit TctC
MKRNWSKAVIGAALLAAGASTGAQTGAPYPNKPVRVLVGWPAGGGADIVARIVADGLSSRLEHRFTVDNRPGASGNLGAELAARAAPDGYTLLVVGVNHASNLFLYSKSAYDPVKDFEPVSLLTGAPNLLVVHPSVPAKSIQELVAYARSRPGQILYGSAGNGTTGHLAMELFKSTTGIDMQHVPYKGGAQFVTDLAGGQVMVGFDNILSSGPHVQSGRMRAIGSSTARRSPLLPDVPTVAESGYPGFEVVLWQGLLAPAGTPREIIDKLNLAVRESLRRPEVQKRFNDLAIEAFTGSPEDFKSFLAREIDKWGRVIKAVGVRLD